MTSSSTSSPGSTVPSPDLAVPLPELKRMNIPRASIARIGSRVDAPDGRTLADLCADDEALRAAVEEHLRHFAWLTAADAARIRGFTPSPDAEELLAPCCPGCMTRGWFGWGVQHGCGSCSCGWPGRYYHFIADPDPDAPCRDEECARPKSEHEEKTRTWRSLESDAPPRVETYRVCPGGDPDSMMDEYRPRDVLRFHFVLWAHPYEVSQRQGRKR